MTTYNYTQFTILQLLTKALAKVGNIYPTQAQIDDALLQFNLMLDMWYSDSSMTNMQDYGFPLPEHDYTNTSVKIELPNGVANTIVWNLAALLMTDYGVQDQTVLGWAKKTMNGMMRSNTHSTNMYVNPTAQVR
jgi:hypothetical protein